MATIDLHGITWKVQSPSVFGYAHPDGNVHIGFNGRAWVMAIDGEWGTTEWATRDEAARAVADTLALRELRA